MSTKLHMPNFDQSRASSETEQRYLLADSVSPSESASAIADIDGDGDRTPRARSPHRASATLETARHQSIAEPERAHTQATYRGFASEQAYMDALRAWADSKRFAAPTETTLLGFYGETTMEEYASRPPALQPLELRKKWKAMRASRQEQKLKRNDERRATIA
ncbi:hypothetical protein AMS68_007317 [Peltaster fructicola]|uniref:Uncharacterized protein n=1 Tax=Peltaster fructicola TaxID=286661 RepID=A0A6H0Y5B5_9PEZI|nr:hypothetical protein AMS68_007317 [Peltaster fructicola]